MCYCLTLQSIRFVSQTMIPNINMFQLFSWWCLVWLDSLKLYPLPCVLLAPFDVCCVQSRARSCPKETKMKWRLLTKTLSVVMVMFCYLQQISRAETVSALCCTRHRQPMCVWCVPSAGGLSIQETERKLVSPEVWAKLREYFPKAPEFSQNQEACQQCLVRRLVGWLMGVFLQSC